MKWGKPFCMIQRLQHNGTLTIHSYTLSATLQSRINDPGSLIFFFEKNPGGTLLLRWGRLFIFHTNYRGVDYLGGVADILGLLRHIFWHFSSKWLQGGHLFLWQFPRGSLISVGSLIFFHCFVRGVAYFGGVVYSGLKSSAHCAHYDLFALRAVFVHYYYYF